MARLTPAQRRAVASQMRDRIRLEKILERETRKVFRRYTTVIVSFHQKTGVFYFPPSLTDHIKNLLVAHYKRCARKFSAFTRSINAQKWNKLIIEKKVWQIQKKEINPARYIGSIDERMKARLFEDFEKVAAEKADRIAATSAIEIEDYVARIRKIAEARGDQISRQELSKLIKDFYYTRSDKRSTSIGITETTYAIEKTKEVEIEEVVDELDDDELLALAEEDPDYEDVLVDLTDILDELSGEEGVSAEDVLAAGGLLALAVGASVTKTWVATLDDATRESHAEADGQEVGIDEPFNVDGEDLDYPGDDSGSPENVCNCRCSVVYGI